MIKVLSKFDLESLSWVDELEGPSFHWNKKLLLAASDSHEFWGLLQNQNIVAFVGFVVLPVACEISVLATHPGSQKQGLMQSLLQNFINAKCHNQEVWLDVHAANMSAIRLYLSLGFKQVGLRPKYYSDGGDALLFSLSPQL